MPLVGIVKKLTSVRSAVDTHGRFTAEVQLALEELLRSINDNVTTTNTEISAVEADIVTVEADIVTANTNIEAAAQSAAHTIGNPSSFVWNSDTSGVYPAGNPTRDLVLTFYDEDSVEIAERTLRGTLTTASGNISITAVSNTGLSTTYSTTGNASPSARADITVTLSGGQELTGSLAWSSVDLSVAGGTPGTGGGK